LERALPARIAAPCREEIEDPDNEVFVSVVSAWEIAIKQSLGKLTLARPDVGRWLRALGRQVP